LTTMWGTAELWRDDGSRLQTLKLITSSRKLFLILVTTLMRKRDLTHHRSQTTTRSSHFQAWAVLAPDCLGAFASPSTSRAASPSPALDRRRRQKFQSTLPSIARVKSCRLRLPFCVYFFAIGSSLLWANLHVLIPPRLDSTWGDVKEERKAWT